MSTGVVIVAVCFGVVVVTVCFLDCVVGFLDFSGIFFSTSSSSSLDSSRSESSETTNLLLLFGNLDFLSPLSPLSSNCN